MPFIFDLSDLGTNSKVQNYNIFSRVSCFRTKIFTYFEIIFPTTSSSRKEK